jgi:NAD(P)-dependent dehydrogenase (short-subunit alcohol dehydrogenase family)
MHPKGHAALVTGGGSGLGRTTAQRLAALGAKVAILDVNAEAAQAAADAIGGIALQCDVTAAEATAAAIAVARARLGPARILINCAGIAPARRIVGRDGPQPLDDFAKVISVNLIGTFNAMRLAAAAMQTLDPLDDGERGVIVSTASVAAYDGQIGQAAYAASKGGVVSLMLPAAREFAQFGIRVMAIAPGVFATPMVAAMPEDVQASLAAAIPFPKMLGSPEQYADLALHIIENRYLNGEVIRLDGGIRMAPR